MPGRQRGRPERDGRIGPGPAGWIRRTLLLGVIVYVALWAWAGQRVGSAQTAWRDGDFTEAHALLSRAAFWHVRSGRIHDALGVVDLSRGAFDEADRHLATARRGYFHPAAFGEEMVLLGFLRDGHHESARRYAAHRMLIAPTAGRLFYLGVAENALNRLDDADTHLAAAIAMDGSLGSRVDAQKAILEAKRKTGRFDHLVDRNGAPLGGIDLGTGHPVTVAPEMRGLLDGPWGPRLEPGDTSSRIHLTLDLDIQRAAIAALGEQAGALVVIDVASGALLAAASQPTLVASRDGMAPPALFKKYEPGSIMKMLTLSAAMKRGVDVDRFFPMDCAGTETIEGLAFRDWIRHFKVESIDHAVAVSCNILFGRLGREVGREALDAELRLYGFDFQSERVETPGSDFAYEVGTLSATDAERPMFALARRAEGLDSIDITPIGAALLAAGLARGGEPPQPYMIRMKTNVLGETYDGREGRLPDPAAATSERAAVIVRTMKAAVSVTGPAEGTARRAAVDGLVAAMKTGTSGANPPGFDALMIGFAPADDPRIAWGLVAEHAGKAEIVAARITKVFLERVKDRLR